MADEIKIIRWCDVCPPRTTPATRRWRALVDVERGPGLAQPRVLDTCESHEKIPETFLGVLREHGRVERAADAAKAPTATTAALPSEQPASCPLCATPLSARGTVIAHLVGKHGARRPPVPKRCPDCRKPLDAHAMRLHRHRAHGYDLVAELVASVKDAR